MAQGPALGPAADEAAGVPLWPRYDWEPADLVGRPVWLYPREMLDLLADPDPRP